MDCGALAASARERIEFGSDCKSRFEASIAAEIGRLDIAALVA
jgi:hypothetical protein